MKKKVFVITLILISISHSFVLSASVISRYESDRDAQYISPSANANVSQYNTNGELIDQVSIEASQGWYFRCNGRLEFNFTSGDTETVYINQIQSQASVCFPDSDGDDNGSDCGCIFNTPGWEDYMGRINDIIDAIPSPPNWGQVANTFRDSIVPRLINDTRDMLGYAPSLPSEPSYPDTIRGGITEPRGNNAPGLDDASFGVDDIRDGTPIEVVEDDSGGFNIVDPIDNLPSQEEFKDNIPKESDMIPPDVPDVEGEAPADPEEQENIAPSPDEIEGTAPTPTEEENQAPGPPEENYNPTPTPGEDEGTTAPIPDDRENAAPTPDDNGFNAPIPGSEGNNAPLPGSDIGDVPLPSESVP
ncbi:hypothetical protein [Amphibacillus cookii]|uniref:hypothetical protein n=1 Tax=Amphibacillus cookii TaxID=767787 RepID=UPI00195A0E16|nr:hypothetical protein [Amphibacillus cookii]MBM7543254.1 hypothetical protein [Amphibacillus cookii]